MTDRAQFEAMLEALINDDQQAAKEIFHNIVVGKSREIYEELLAEDFSAEEANRAIGGNAKTESMEEDGEEEAPMEEDGEEEAPMEEEDDSEEDSADDEEDGEEDPFGGDDDGEEEPEGDIEDRVMDLEDALEDLKAEFEQLLSQEGEEGGHDMDAIHDAGDDSMDMDMDMGGDEEPEDESVMHHVHHVVNEYVNKVPMPKHGDDGVNTKSAVAGKNDMGGTTANIAKNFSTTSGGTQGGLLKPSTTLQDGGNINKPGANAGKTGFKKQEPGHGAEKSGKKESGTDKKSLIGGKIR
jgi:ElaB/YqjD/DUF883 family membrane-anchored ribosome-binding protein